MTILDDGKTNIVDALNVAERKKMTLGKLLETKRNEARLTRQYLSDLTQVPRDWIILAEQELLENDLGIIDRADNRKNFEKVMQVFGININELPKGETNVIR